MKKAIKSVKQVFESDNVIITKITQGHSNDIRIDARTRFHIADVDNFFSKWVKESYANIFCKEKFGKKVNELTAYNY